MIMNLFLGECPEGMNCTSSSQGHFKTYLHTQLAYARSNCDMVCKVHLVCQKSLTKNSKEIDAASFDSSVTIKKKDLDNFKYY